MASAESSSESSTSPPQRGSHGGNFRSRRMRAVLPARTGRRPGLPACRAPEHSALWGRRPFASGPLTRLPVTAAYALTLAETIVHPLFLWFRFGAKGVRFGYPVVLAV